MTGNLVTDALLNAVQAHLDGAIATHQAGRPADALRRYRAVICALICHKEVEDLHASALYALGQLGAAVKAFRLSATGSQDPKSALVSLCGQLREAGHGNEALLVLRQLAALKPTVTELLDLAEVELALGRPEEALVHADAARTVANPAMSAAGRLRLVRGSALRRMDRLVEARDALTGIHDETVFNLMLHFERAATFEALGEGAACRAAARQGLVIDPGTVELFGRAAHALPGDRNEPDVPRWGTYVRPDSSRLWTMRAARSFERGDVSETIRLARRALLLEPGDGAAYGNLLGAVHMQAPLPGAVRIWQWMACLGSLPDAARFAAGLVALEEGYLGAGWALFEGRFGLDDAPTRIDEPPVWNGGPVGDYLLVMTEQGLGDEVLFLSCLPDLLEDVDPNRLLIECDRRLVPLFEQRFPEVTVLPRQTRDGIGGQAAAFDYRGVRTRYGVGAAITNGALAARYRADASRPAPKGYLQPDAEASAAWRAKPLADASPGALRVGLCWRSGVSSAVRDQTYASIEDMVPILEAGREAKAVFLSLQYDDIDTEAARAEALTGVRILTPEGLDQRNDLVATAAFLGSLDLVISVATFQAAFAGALGVPTLKLWSSYFVPLADRDLFLGTVTPMLHSTYEAGHGGLPLAISRAADRLRSMTNKV